jgi:hypothetical protein
MHDSITGPWGACACAYHSAALCHQLLCWAQPTHTPCTPLPLPANTPSASSCGNKLKPQQLQSRQAQGHSRAPPTPGASPISNVQCYQQHCTLVVAAPLLVHACGDSPAQQPWLHIYPVIYETAPLRCFPQQSRPCSCCIPTWICTEIRWGDRHGQLHACGCQVWQALLRAQGHTPGLMLGVDPHTARLCGCNGHKAARHDRAPG